MKASVRLRLLRYFVGAFLIYSMVLGVCFVILFLASHTSLHRGDLETRATRIAETLSDYTVSSDSVGSSGGHGSGMGHGSRMGTGFGAYVNFIDDVAMAEVWVVDADLNQIVRGHGQQNLSYQDLPQGAENVIRQAMEGKTTFTDSFNDLLPAPVITVAAPIFAQDGQVAGAVLLHEQVDVEAPVINRTFAVLLISMAVAIALATVTAILFSRRFTTPLAKMKSAAISVSQGDYTVTTGVRQNDEIGALATALDEMAAQLGEASRLSEASDRRRREFMATISHELRTPVTVIRGSMEALRDRVVTDPVKVDQYHQQVLSEAILLERLVADLLELARLQNPDFTIEKSLVNLKDLSADVVRSLRGMAGAKRVEVRLDAKGELPTVSGDYARLRQMVVIVVDNAVKFSPHDSVIDIRLRRTANAVTLSVSDQGPGISGEELPRIFDRFHTTRSAQNGGGTGLGLAIAQQIAQRHGVTITVRSEPGQGTCFEFVFPDEMFIGQVVTS